MLMSLLLPERVWQKGRTSVYWHLPTSQNFWGLYDLLEAILDVILELFGDDIDLCTCRAYYTTLHSLFNRSISTHLMLEIKQNEKAKEIIVIHSSESGTLQA
ncbi:hypothetical protein Nepgr_015781 [Nepenthes gracilis]|uniref:Uncharacterized protein n=1 Tax=Nepenthes gracilis TaxID=150966 RepID=A0AAD3SLI7_NEPGR|nr:hypothetical protein Nepgr_015781 [Nepenthes gracilis]